MGLASTHPFVSLAYFSLVFIFSLAFKNTSLYDPAWCAFPFFLALGWCLTVLTSGGALSARALYSLLLIAAWWPTRAR